MTTTAVERARSLDVTVVDDREEEARDIQTLLTGRGIRSTIVVPDVQKTFEEIVEQLISSSTATLCDHRLTEQLGVRYSGARLVSHLNRRHHPSVLFSSYTDEENYEIKSELEHLPAYLVRDDVHKVDRVAAALDSAYKEVLEQNPVQRRKTFPTLIRIERILNRPDGVFAKVVIPAWHRDDDVLIPLRLLVPNAPKHLKSLVDQRFMGMVNICAEEAREIFVTDVRPATTR